MPRPSSRPEGGAPSTETGRKGTRSIRTKEQVVDAALDVVASDGIERLTMQKVAERLDIGVMTLYTYVANKQELLDEVSRRVQEEIFDKVPLPTPETTWQDDLIAHFTDARRRLSRQPSLAVLLLRSGRAFAASSSDRVPRALEVIFAKMHHEGLDGDTAAMVFSAAAQYVNGFALREAERHLVADAGAADAALWTDRLERLPPDEFPHLRAASASLLASTNDDHFAFGLTALIRGAAKQGGRPLPSGPTSGPHRTVREDHT